MNLGTGNDSAQKIVFLCTKGKLLGRKNTFLRGRNLGKTLTRNISETLFCEESLGLYESSAWVTSIQELDVRKIVKYEVPAIRINTRPPFTIKNTLLLLGKSSFFDRKSPFLKSDNLFTQNRGSTVNTNWRQS